MSKQSKDGKNSKSLNIVPPELFRNLRERAGVSLQAAAKKFPDLPDWESGKQQIDANDFKNYQVLEEYAGSMVSSYGILLVSIKNPDYVNTQFFRTDSDPIPDHNQQDMKWLDHRIPKDLGLASAVFKKYLYQVSRTHTSMQTMAVEHFGSKLFDPSEIPSREELLEIGTIQNIASTLAEHRIQVFAELVTPSYHGCEEILAETVLDPKEFHGITMPDALVPWIALNLWAPDNVQNLLHAVDLIRENISAIYHLPESCYTPEQLQHRTKQRNKVRRHKPNPKDPDPLFLQNGHCGVKLDPDQQLFPLPVGYLLWLEMKTRSGEILYTDAFNYAGRTRHFDDLVNEAMRLYQEQYPNQLQF